MKSHVVRSLALSSLAALVACTSGGLDESTREGSADSKSLSRPTAQAPAFRGALGIKSSHNARPAAVTNTAPSNAHLTYYGGNIIEHPAYTNVYWGAWWTSGAGLGERQHSNAFTQAVPTTPEFTSAMVEYTGAGGKTIHDGTYAGEKAISGEPGKTISDDQIKTTIQSWVSSGLVPAPSLDQLYVLYFPPGTSITLGTDASCTTFCGYHSTIHTASGAGGLIRYIVIPHPDCGGCQFEGNVQDSVTVVASHEMWEADTDADVGLATALGPPLAWYDQNNGENADICAGDASATLHGYRVQTTWSNAENRCVAQRSVGAQPPDFSVSLAPPSQTVTQGASASYTVVATPANGFAGSITWSVSGLPSGAQGSFSGTGNSQSLSIAVGASNAAGSYSFTVTGASGSLSHAASATLVVNAAAQPDFSLAVSPAAVSLQAGASAHATLSVGASNGFSVEVALSSSGAPNGVSVAFSSASVHGQGSAEVTVSASASAAAGSYTVTLTGQSGGDSHSVALGVTVKAAPPPGTGVVFSDDAENGNAGWTFSSKHAGDPLWGIETSTASKSGNHRFRSNLSRNYANDTATFMISPAFSLAGASKSTLKFTYKFATEDYYDNFYVWASGDNGSTWTKVAEGSGVSQGWNGWAPQAVIDLSRFAGKARVRIAFSLQSDYSVSDWGVALDDISVTAQ